MVKYAQDRVLFLDILRIVGLFAVILIHSTFPYGEKIFQDRPYDWWMANIYSAIARWSVPIMIMISGALLLNPKKDDTISIFFKKRFNRIFIPIMFWSIFYMIWNGTVQISEVTTILSNLIKANVNFHLWFVYLIMGLYIATPILRIFIKNADKIYIEYFIIIWIISNISTYSRMRYDIGLGVEISFFTGFIGYYILGYYLANIDNDSYINKNMSIKYLIYILSLLGIFISIFGTYILISEQNVLDQFFYNYLSPNVMVTSIGIFIFFKNIDWKKIKIFENPKIYSAIIEISTLTFGIYLVHALILLILRDMDINFILAFGPIIGIPLLAIITSIVSYSLVKTLFSMPILRHIV